MNRIASRPRSVTPAAGSRAVWSNAFQRSMIPSQGRPWAAETLFFARHSAEQGIHDSPDNYPSKLGKEPQGGVGFEKGKG